MPIESFLAAIKQLTEPTSIEMVKQIQRVPIATPLSPQPLSSTFVTAGEGVSPIVLLHGFDSSLIEFRHLLPLLAKHTETWAIDLLGFGFGERSLGLPYGPLGIKVHLHSFWQTMIGRPMTLVGASMGGAAAIDFALSYPAAVSKLVLIDSIGYTGPPAYVQLLFPPLDALAVEYLRQRKLRALDLSIWTGVSPVVLDLLRCSALHYEIQNWQESMIAFVKSGGYNFLGDHIPQISQPTLILWGESDDVLGTSDADRFQREIQNSQLIWIENCGHTPQLEQPERTAHHLLQFHK
jgi:pimeloyl-ACP methyl ester carboxylesterase